MEIISLIVFLGAIMTAWFFLTEARIKETASERRRYKMDTDNLINTHVDFQINKQKILIPIKSAFKARQFGSVIRQAEPYLLTNDKDLMAIYNASIVEINSIKLQSSHVSVAFH